MVEIVNYEEKYRTVFRDINVEWISHYFKMEEEDYKYLEHPKENIIDKGGAILVALMDGEAVGVCSLVKINEQKYELAKMGVRPAARGKKIGWLLGQATIKKAKEMNATTLFLESNRVLTPAISLYHKLGFKEVTGGCSVYARCDIQMEMEL
jgi:GNAT superfamily N-acetyltransferase